MTAHERRQAIIGTALIFASSVVLLAYGFVPVPQPPVPPIFVRKTAVMTAEVPNSRLRNVSVNPGDLVTSPLVVTGEARLWYFEASFPVQLVDADGRVLTQRPATAQGDWMTEDFVPFRVALDFPEPETAVGALILKKDNPSGLPELDDQVRISVRFRP